MEIWSDEDIKRMEESLIEFEMQYEKKIKEIEQRRKDDDYDLIEYYASMFGTEVEGHAYELSIDEERYFIDVVQRYKAVMHSIAYQITRNYTTAQDAVQEGLYKSFKAWKSYRKERREALNMPSWIYKVIKNTAVSMKNKKFERDIPLEKTNWWIMAKCKKFEQPEDNRDRHEMIDMLRNALRNLKEVKRRIIFLYYIDGYTDAAIADIVHRPLGTIKKYRFDALREMRAMLEKEGLEKEDIGKVVESYQWLARMFDQDETSPSESIS